MKPAELVALYAAHGIDLQHVAGTSTRTDKLAKKRRLTFDERRAARGRPIIETAEGSGSRVVRPRVWSHAEVGICAGGVQLRADGKPVRDRNGNFVSRCPRMPWLAACYSLAGDYEGYKELHRGLTLKALDMAAAGDWWLKITFATGVKAHYIERLTELVLDAEGCPAYFTVAAQQLVDATPHALYMGVAEDVWRKPLYAYFVEIQGQYQRWLDTAKGVIGQWLRQEDLQPEIERRSVAPEPPNAA